MPGHHTFPVNQQHFVVDRKYQFIQAMGQGAYGVVCAAKDTQSDKQVAIKKVCRVFEKSILAKRALRELKLLRHFNGHKNITSVLDMDIVDPQNFNELYLVLEFMQTDLHYIIKSGQILTDAHYQYIIYQICVGLKYIHSANVLHRDLKPGNILLNADCGLKICDFGLARGFSESLADNAGFMTEYVATRWYRAPEIMLSFQNYTKAIDMWSVGCIFAEMLGGTPLFRGRDYVDQLNQILIILGTPDEETLRRIGSERVQSYIRRLPWMPKVPFEQLYPQATSFAIDLLSKLLEFDPAKRITVEEALAHPYLRNFHSMEDEPVHDGTCDFSFEALDSIEDIRREILQEVMAFKASTHGLLQPLTHPRINQRQNRSLSHRDRVTFARSRHVAARTRAAASYMGCGSNAAPSRSATPSNVVSSPDMDDMEVIELEKELGGGA
ncbi:MAP kinase [Fennellomyces sp. T-0311]|nr:MAP kinase [Fennellomyces sp. T-0311]